MIARTRHLPANKAWRFLPDAMDVFERQKSFDDRQLHATGYLARVVRAYAETLFDRRDADGKTRNHVWMLPGRMTAMLRHRWGVNLGDHNRKDRNDHRHHAIDAAVIGVIDPAMINRLQNAARTIGADTLSRVLPAPPEPFPGYRAQVMAAAAHIHISHRARHAQADPTDPSRTSGRLHEDTAYGLIRRIPQNKCALKIGNVVVRKPVTSLTAGEIGHVRDKAIRNDLLAATESHTSNKNALAEALTAWSERTGHKRLRVIKTDTSVRGVNDKAGQPYKWMVPAENSYIDILEAPGGTWFRHGTDIWSAHSKTTVPWQQAHPQARFVMRLFKGDTIQLFDWDKKKRAIIPASNRIMLVTSIPNSETNKYVRFQPVNDATNENSSAAAFNVLRLRRARRVRIDELGRVHTIPHGTL